MNGHQTRGERNKNPGNIERNGIAWQGMSPVQTDERFLQFIDAEHGIRAIAKLLLSYENHHHLKTVRQKIDRWAPPVENDTDAYADHVAKICGVGPDDPADANDTGMCTKLVMGIIEHENGHMSYTGDVLSSGVHMAFGS